jgi:hypothetical protein
LLQQVASMTAATAFATASSKYDSRGLLFPADQLCDQRASRGELSPHPALHGSSGQLGWAGGGPGGSKSVTGPLGSIAGEPDRCRRQLLCSLNVQTAGAWQVRRRTPCVRPIGRCRICKYKKPRQRNVLHPVRLLGFSRPANAQAPLQRSTKKRTTHCGTAFINYRHKHYTAAPQLVPIRIRV